MNLYLRLIMTIIKCFFCSKKAVNDTSVLTFMAWPWDCDINIHLNNARFLSFMDLSRVYWTAQIGLMPAVLKNHWQGVAGGIEISYIRPIKPFQRFKIITQMIYFDEHYVYLEQSFISSKKTLHAVAIVKVTLLLQGRKIRVQDALSHLNKQSHMVTPPMPEVLKHWQEMRKWKARTPKVNT